MRARRTRERCHCGSVLGATAAGFTLVGANAARAEVLYVDAGSPLRGDGSTWATAFNSLGEALAIAVEGDEVRIAQGVYKPSATGERDVSFVQPAGVKLLGGYRGAWTSRGRGDPDERDISLYPTELAGDYSSGVGSIDAADLVLHVFGDSPYTLVDGVTVRHGYGTGGLLAEGSLTLHNCTFAWNHGYNGGAAVTSYGTLLIDACSFHHNGVVSDDDGGTVASYDASATVLASAFVDNDGATFAGGIRSAGGALTVAECSFLSNNTAVIGGIKATDTVIAVSHCHFAQGAGGLHLNGTTSGTVTESTFTDLSDAAIRSSAKKVVRVSECEMVNCFSPDGGSGARVQGPIEFRGCRFQGNSTGPSQGAGGAGVRVLGPLDGVLGPSFVDCLFLDNVVLSSQTTTAIGGGAFIDGPARFVDCRFLGNAAREGGGIAVRPNSGAVLVSCDVSGNSATLRGGGLATESSSLIASNLTLSANVATVGAGVLFTGSATQASIANSIVWGNTINGQATFAAQISDLATGTPKINFCCIQGLTGSAFGGTGNTNVNPLLIAPLGFDGVAGTEDDDLSLALLSPVVDAGANGLVPNDLEDVDGDGLLVELSSLDVLGLPRFMDGVAPTTGCGAGSIVDLGSREAHGPATGAAIGDFDGNGWVDGVDLAIQLSSWGMCASTCCLADLNGDTLVNAADLSIFLSGWTPSPPAGGGSP